MSCPYCGGKGRCSAWTHEGPVPGTGTDDPRADRCWCGCPAVTDCPVCGEEKDSPSDVACDLHGCADCGAVVEETVVTGETHGGTEWRSCLRCAVAVHGRVA